MATITIDSVVVVESELVAAPLGDEELVILHVESGQYYSLNPLGAEIWQLVQEPRQVAEIVEAITTAYDVERERCQADVVALLRDMANSRLVAAREATPGDDARG